MEIYQVMVSGLLNTIVYALLFVGVLKVWTMSKEVSEIKELLRDLKRMKEAETLAASPAPNPSAQIDVEAVLADAKNL